MSPIIYTPHKCETPAPQDVACPHPVGTLWQCETCYAIHEAEDARTGLWVQVSDPKRVHRVEEARRWAAPRDGLPTAPTVTPDMVQLVLDTYAEHMSVTPNDGAEPLGWCGECETGIYGPHTIQAHAREKAAEALQGALAAGETR